MAPVDIEEVVLPGVGIRYEFQTARGRSVAIVVHRSGAVDLSTFREDDSDAAVTTLRMQREEAAALADLLGAPRLTQRLADLSKEIPGLQTVHLTIEPGTPFAGRSLGDTRARTRTGCSVIAVVRSSGVVTAPGPEEPLHVGDVIVAIGSEHGLSDLASILAG
jgi:TrkA domain protein